MKVYLSVPMVRNRSYDRAKVIADVIRSTGHELVSPWVLGNIEPANPKDVNVFFRDLNGVEHCDILIADVSEPSTGVGMEIMAAYMAKKRIILCARKGSIISRMLLHMDRKELIEFDDNESLSTMLYRILSIS